MNKFTKSVLAYLKPKVASLGFKKADVESFAADIAENLSVEEGAADEDVEKAVAAAVDASLPAFKIAQKAINRAVEEYKKAHPEKADEPAKPESGKDDKTVDGGKHIETKDDEPAYVKDLQKAIVALSEQITSLKTEKLHDTRRKELETMLKDTGSFGKQALRNFSRMRFDSDEDYAEFKSEVERDLADYNQERADAGLAKLGPTEAGKRVTEKPEVMSDKQLDALAKIL